MKIVPLTPERYADWDAFVLQHPCGWFWHTSYWIRYSQAYCQNAVDHSFALEFNGRILGICTLLQEGHEFSMGGNPCPWPLHGGYRDLMQANIERIANEKSIDRMWFRSSPLVANVLMDLKGFDNVSWKSQVIDLTKSESVLHRDLRKSYQSLVNKALRMHEIVVPMGQRDATMTLRELHIHEAGRETRSRATWELMADWAKQGNGLVMLAIPERTSPHCIAGGAYFILYKRMAYYACGVYQTDNLSHGMIWKAMLELKARGITHLEVGWLDRPGDSEKDKGIAHFKSGFGGEAVPMVVLSKG